MLENQIKKLSWYVFITMILVGLIFVYGYFLQVVKEKKPFGSVQTASEYQGTTVKNASAVAQQIKTEPGTLGSVIITGAGAGYFELYNATTTDAATRTTTATTSLTLLASFPANAAVGTYTFDRIFTDGLLGYWYGAIGTTTITWR